MSVSVDTRHYELLLILDPTLDERTVAPSIDQFLNVVRQGDGTVDSVDVWGKRRLAYDIAKNSEGIYALINVRCGADTVKELDRQLNLNESVLRTKITRPVHRSNPAHSSRSSHH